MLNVRNATKRRTEEGASAVEYGLLVAAIAALIVVIVFVLGGLVSDVFQGTCDEIETNAKNVTVTESCSDAEEPPAEG